MPFVLSSEPEGEKKLGSTCIRSLSRYGQLRIGEHIRSLGAVVEASQLILLFRPPSWPSTLQRKVGIGLVSEHNLAFGLEPTLESLHTFYVTNDHNVRYGHSSW